MSSKSVRWLRSIWRRRHGFNRLQAFLVVWSFITILVICLMFIKHPHSATHSHSNYKLSAINNKLEKLPFQRIPEQQDILTGLDLSEAVEHLEDNSYEDGRMDRTSTHQPQISQAYKFGDAPQMYRQGKVFILIVQDEFQSHIHQSSQTHIPMRREVTGGRRKLRYHSSQTATQIPTHIEFVMDVLRSHKVSFVIDNTRNGMPQSLLQSDSQKESDRGDSDTIEPISVILIDDFVKYTQLSRWTRDQLDRFCRANKVGVISFISNIDKESLLANSGLHKSNTTNDVFLLDRYPLAIQAIHNFCRTTNASKNVCLQDYEVNSDSQILRIVKSKREFVISGPLTTENHRHDTWISLISNHETFEPITLAKVKSKNSTSHEGPSRNDNIEWPRIDEKLVFSLLDKGHYDDIKRVLFGSAKLTWLHKALLIDAIEHLSKGKILTPLDRYIQIDIDDIFVGETGKRMVSSDVEALVQTQYNLANRYFVDKEFKFNLGYSGKYFKSGNDDEDKGDESLLKSSSNFTWFCHTWSHSKAHLASNVKIIKDELIKNRNFGLENNLIRRIYDNNSELLPSYVVAPHHSGVYPVHEQLYDAWLEVLNAQVTSTEEYPHLRPANQRHGFSHKTIKVMPRQTCGLFTHTILRNQYPGGFQKLDALIDGGELFETILFNPVNVYMSHMTNYANDRLALYTFNRLFEFVSNYTNLKFRYTSPLKLASYYFQLFPEQIEPLWTNPCTDKRHLAIWASEKIEKYCKVTPKLFIVGPQKTGTTALLEFLMINPMFATSKVDKNFDFEEIQFFNDKHYKKGIDWYFERFVDSRQSARFKRNNYVENSDDQNNLVYIDKSATYFDDPSAPKRLFAFAPNARIIISLINPADRAYSWYQHELAHNNPAAVAYSFERIIALPKSINKNQDVDNKTASTTNGDDNENTIITRLRNRCLIPGHYEQHIRKWLSYFPPRQLIIVDGVWFKKNPSAVLMRLQQLILARDSLQYKNYDPNKSMATESQTTTEDQHQFVDYLSELVFDSQKGFYCQRKNLKGSSNVNNNHYKTQCLGSSKGRKYPPMSAAARDYLNIYYRSHNIQLAKLFSDQLGNHPIPEWLEDALSSTPAAYRFL